MKALVGRAEARAHDAAAVAVGVSGLLLMENAGRGATDVLLERFAGALDRPLVVGGTGQNGGDAWVVARHLLARGLRPECVLLGEEARVHGDAAVQWKALRGLGISVEAVGDGPVEGLMARAARASVLVDGVFGTGLERPIEGGRAEALARLATCGVPSFALDLPSGVDADEGTVLGVAWPASVTATFGAHKRGLHQHPGAALAGEVVVVSLGVPVPSPSRTVLLEASDLVHGVPVRAAHTHKGMAGHVTVFGGSPGRTGAALLAGLGAMRSGAGLVTLAPRGNVRAALDAKVVELMTTEIPEALEAGIRAALTEAEGRSSCVVGPGLGLDSTARSYALRLALGLPVPTVLDADALTAIGSDVHTLRAARGTRVLTPHPGEAARLLGCSASDVQAGRYHAAEALAARCGQVVVLKGAGTIIASPDGRVAVSRAGTPALGVAGTGDVLAGVVASMLVSLPPFEAACAAVLAHGRAGELAAEFDRGLLAREVADALPRALAAGRMGR